VAHRIDVSGTVQGVGFRPFVWRLASQLRLDGSVRNVAGRVEIDVSGPPASVATLITRLRTTCPPLATVESVTVRQLDAPSVAAEHSGFVVAPSPVPGPASAAGSPSGHRLFPPDLATCDACLGELSDPNDRRFRYPFINCTDCGPRATIIDSLPYDRSRTTMVDFPLCADCEREYNDPADRRFHAEPIACPSCGPTLRWLLPGPATGAPATGPAALRAAVDALSHGQIVAVKGLGGYHLACDASNDRAVSQLRERKRRWAKPFAVMVADLAMAGKVASLDAAEITALRSAARPIVLCRPVGLDAGHHGHPRLTATVTQGVSEVGLFLPYTGLHHLLLSELDRPLVLTSGNRADEPIAIDDEEAIRRLGDLADGFLAHNRRIRSRYEDSVVRIANRAPVMIRRARGHAPTPRSLPVAAPEPLLAVGAQLKHTFTVASRDRAHLAAHLGDLSDVPPFEAYRHDLGHLLELLAVDPGWVAHDLHPGYLSTQHAYQDFDQGRRIPVQHHHAHAASCLAEHGLTGPAVCVTLDGLGLGDDGTLWGGEILIADLIGYRRVARFGKAPLPGGEAAIAQPWRMALGYLLAGEGDGPDSGGLAGAGLGDQAQPYLASIDPAVLRTIRRQLERGVNAPVASSAGRLFDAASALLGLCETADYEAQAAIALEQAADPSERGELPHLLVQRDGLAVFDPRPTLAALLTGVADGVPVPVLAARFQRAVVSAVTNLATHSAQTAGLDLVCLSGGVFCNAWLLAELPRRLESAGLTVLHNRHVPAGDGGVSFGQAAVAAARMAAGLPGPFPASSARHVEGVA
jgi:hydrogenase maturation protein HypF